jgi:hypothetical protein
MTSWQKAHAWAMRHGITPAEWKQKLEQALLGGGYVFVTPDDFMVAERTEHEGEPAYFIYMALGTGRDTLRRLGRYFPEPLPWVLWHRRNEPRLRAFRWDKLAKKVRI